MKIKNKQTSKLNEGNLHNSTFYCLAKRENYWTVFFLEYQLLHREMSDYNKVIRAELAIGLTTEFTII